MSKRLAVAVTICALAVSCALGAGGDEPATPASRAESAAREKALSKLRDSVMALNLNETQTVAQYMAATSVKPEQYPSVLLKGAEALPPTEYLEDGRAQVKVRLSMSALIENLKQVAQEQGAAGPKLDMSALEKVPLEMSLMEMGAGTPAPIQQIPGWEDVTTRKRIAVDSAARADAVSRLVAQAGELPAGKTPLKELMESKPEVRAAVGKFFAGVKPASKSYYPGGIAAVTVSVTGADMWDALATALKPATADQPAPVDLKELEEAAARDKDKKLAATGHARLDGNPFDPVQLIGLPVKVELPPATPPASTLGEK